MGWFKRLTSGGTSLRDGTVVTFTGGMGAQILSAAIYWHLESQGRKVWADLSYFDRPEHLATVGNKGDCSHWAWQMDGFGCHLADFLRYPHLDRDKFHRIEDGAEKLELALEALTQKSIQARLCLPAQPPMALDHWYEAPFLCLHVRRGDYVNVASHLISDQEFLDIAKPFRHLVKTAVVLSDSPITPTLRDRMTALFEECIYLDNTDAFTAHCVMRKARILIGSNSQFSLIAGMLNSDGLFVMPKKWFGDGLSQLERPLAMRCKFQVLSV